MQSTQRITGAFTAEIIHFRVCKKSYLSIVGESPGIKRVSRLGNRSRAGDCLIFPANSRKVPRPVGWLSSLVPAKWCLSPKLCP